MILGVWGWRGSAVAAALTTDLTRSCRPCSEAHVDTTVTPPTRFQQSLTEHKCLTVSVNAKHLCPECSLPKGKARLRYINRKDKFRIHEINMLTRDVSLSVLHVGLNGVCIYGCKYVWWEIIVLFLRSS